MAALATARRDGAKRARMLARDATDALAQDGLRRYAEELDKQADELEAQIAALNAAAAAATADDDERIIAVTRPGDKR